MKTFSRRDFLQQAALGAGGAIALSAMPLLPTSAVTNYDGRKLNIALCGLGNYAGALAYGLESSQYCRLAGIVTGHPAKAEQWKKQYTIPGKNIYNYDNFDEIVHNKDIDLVYVVLPNAMHRDFVIRAAAAGKHVITEKPMAVSVKECEEMIDACKKAGVQLAVGYRLHYEPYHLELKRLGQQKVFGPVRLIEASLGFKSDDASGWRLKKALAGGGPLMDVGIYCIQSSRYVLGEEPVSATAQFGTVTNAALFSEVEASITWQLQFPGGAVCNSSCAYNVNIDRFFAAADEGSFELSPGLSYGPFKGKTSRGELNFPTINQQATQLDAIGKLLLDNKPLPMHITGEEGMKDIKIIRAVYEAAETGGRVLLA
jgi:predicted dehydrogenase